MHNTDMPDINENAPLNGGRTMADALLDAQRRLEAVEKTRTNTFHKFKYASAEDIIHASREALNAAGVVVLVTSTAFDYAPVVATEPNAPPRPDAHAGLLRSEFKVLAANCDEVLEFVSTMPVIAERGRPLDKALCSAATQTLGYTLRSLLLIPRDDESDSVDGRDDRPKPDKQVVVKAPASTAKEESTGDVLMQLLDNVRTAKELEFPQSLAKANWKKLSDADKQRVGDRVNALKESFK